MTVAAAQVVVAGEARGPVLSLDEPLSFWGGLSAESGLVTDEHHPQTGACLTGVVLVMRAARGSSSASSVLAEAVRLGTAPAAIVMIHPDEILATGAIVADELYGRTVPIVLVSESDYPAVAAATHAVIAADGSITVS
ncbi:MAG: DUF126 domain-containing protein [Acidimicrobiales bacterium]|jgi:hypothetical protein|nr:DUF126 domain-containing protein [Acidimicrobiales bacterium]